MHGGRKFFTSYLSSRQLVIFLNVSRFEMMRQTLNQQNVSIYKTDSTPNLLHMNMLQKLLNSTQGGWPSTGALNTIEIWQEHKKQRDLVCSDQLPVFFLENQLIAMRLAKESKLWYL